MAEPIYQSHEFENDDRICEARQRQGRLLAENESTLANADKAKRDLTDSELKDVGERDNEYERLQQQVNARKQVLSRLAQNQRPASARPNVEDDIQQPSYRPGLETTKMSISSYIDRASAEQPTISRKALSPWPRPAAFLAAVRTASTGGVIHQHLVNAVSEGSGEAGGFAVPPDFLTQIMEKVPAATSLLAFCNPMETQRNEVVAPLSESTPWGSAGIQTRWRAEAQTGTTSQPKLGQINVRLHSLDGFVPVTDEMLEDAPFIESFIEREAGASLDFEISRVFAWGTGSGQPLGFMNSPALVTQTAESGQTTDTINVENVTKMMDHMPANSIPSARWLIHPGAVHQIRLLKLGDQPLYIAPGQIPNAPAGTLLGLPIVPHEVAAALGDLGDIMLVDMTKYMAVRKAGGIRTIQSAHVKFLEAQMMFRFTIRIAGAPWFKTPTSSLNGSFQSSPFITLAAR